MEPTLLLVCKDPELSNEYTEALKQFSIQLDATSSMRDMFNILHETAYHGILLDMQTKIKTPREDKALVHNILNSFPLVQLKKEPNTGEIKTYYMGQFGEGGILKEFIEKDCQSAQARRIRSEPRKDLNLSLLVGRDGSMNSETAKKTIAINVSKKGVFVYDTEPWNIGDKVWLIVLNIKDQSPISCTVQWVSPWDADLNIPGIGVVFDDFEASQVTELIETFKI